MPPKPKYKRGVLVLDDSNAVRCKSCMSRIEDLCVECGQSLTGKKIWCIALGDDLMVTNYHVCSCRCLVDYLLGDRFNFESTEVIKDEKEV